MTAPTTTPASSPRSRNAYRVSVILAALHIIFTATLAIVGFRLNIAIMQFTAGITAIIAIASIYSIILYRQNQPVKGIWRILIAMWLLVPTISLFVSGYGWIILVTVPLAIGIIAGFSLPTNRIPLILLLSSVSGVAGLLLDLFGDLGRPAMPNSKIIIPIVTAAAILVGIIVLAREFSRFSLRAKLLVLFLGVALVPLSLFIYINNIFTRNALTESTNKSLSLVAAQTGAQIDEFIQTNLALVQKDAQLSIFQSALELEPENFRTLQNGEVNTLQLLISKNPDYIQSYSLLNREGQYFASYPEVSGSVPDFLGLNPSITNGLKVLLVSNVPYVSPVVLDPETGKSYIYFAGRTNSPEGAPMGLLVLKMDAAILQNLFLTRNAAAGEKSYGILFDENHIILAHGNNPEHLFKLVIPLQSEQITSLKNIDRLPDLPIDNLTLNAPGLEEHLKNANNQPIFTISSEEGVDEDSQVAIAQVATRPWMVAFLQPQEIFLAPVGAQTRINILLSIIIVGIVTVAAIRAAALIGAPISNLTELVEKISSGDMTIQVPVTTQDEIGRLASTFNSMTNQIRNLLSGLESQITDRTLEIDRRALQLQTAAEVARDASAVQDLDTLLNRAVDLIHERFGFYHAAFFLLDRTGEYAVLKASNSDGGKKMLVQGHKLRVGEVGIVGDTTATGRPHIALDVGSDIAFLAQRLLPNTRSEMALPLKVGETIIGALDVQSNEAVAFDEDDIAVLQVMADQLAVAIRNSQLLEEQQQIIHELQTAQGEFTQRSWKEWSRRSLLISGYRTTGATIEPALVLSEESKKAWNSQITITATSDQKSSIAVPIKLRNTTLGVINLTINSDLINPDTINLINAITERLALALDNARLLESTQYRAVQEQMIGEITTKIRSTLDVNTVLKTTIREMRETLGLHDVVVELKAPEREI